MLSYFRWFVTELRQHLYLSLIDVSLSRVTSDSVIFTTCSVEWFAGKLDINAGLSFNPDEI